MTKESRDITVLDHDTVLTSMVCCHGNSMNMADMPFTSEVASADTGPAKACGWGRGWGRGADEWDRGTGGGDRRGGQVGRQGEHCLTFTATLRWHLLQFCSREASSCEMSLSSVCSNTT